MKKGYDLISENTVLAILFMVTTIVVILILVNWWNAYNSRGVEPALRSLDNLQQMVNALDPKVIPTRVIPLQTGTFYQQQSGTIFKSAPYHIRGFNDVGMCGTQKDTANNCICICESSTTCDNAAKNNKKFCRIVLYSTPIDISTGDNLKNFQITLANNAVSAVLSG